MTIGGAANTGNDLSVLRFAALAGIALSVSACDPGAKPDLAAVDSGKAPAKVRKAQVKRVHSGNLQYSALATASKDDDHADETPANPMGLPSDPFTRRPYVLQIASVRDGCLKPEVVAILGKVRAHYGTEPVVTSGCRHGRGRSLHNSGQAVDIIVPGVSPDALIRYVRTIPEVGGTGRYGHNKVVHVDIGAKRQWTTVGGRFRFAMLAH